MGADGHIQVVLDEEVRAAWPDCDELFGYLIHHYVREIAGVKLHTLYWDTQEDHGCWWDESLWGGWPEMAEDEPEKTKARLREFADWLDEHCVGWEVWT